MKVRKRKSALIFIGIICFFKISGQTGDIPEIGKRIPDYTFTSVINYPANKLSLDHLKGKWIFLDFWSTKCSSCIQGFPKLNSLQKQSKDSVDFILVGINHQEYNPNIVSI